MRLIHDGMTDTAVIPENLGYHDEFIMTYRPLAGYELDMWQAAAGVQQVRPILDKLVSWPLIIENDQTAALLSVEERKPLKAGDPLPITEAVLKMLPGFTFQCIRLAIMGILPQPAGKNGQEKKQEAVKN